MVIKIYNTLTRKKEIFKPVKDGEIKIYVCGPTVYDFCHIGHARSAIFFDVIVNYFRSVGFRVIYVRNFTDIDDKIIERSKEKGVTYQKLSRFYIDSFQKDMRTLNVKPADLEPRVTDHIDDIIKTIKILINNGFAYVANKDVYFAVDKLKSYGKLSGRKKEDMIPGSRVTINKNKNNPLDFVLWKHAQDKDPFWKSPWGNGRPGWHIECSAMNDKLLGRTIDIHGGGEDLIFPHHENEIAQSESANKVPLANYWMHNGLVNMNNEKMSKSTGNLKCVDDLVKLYNPEAIRLFLLSSHYKSPIEFSHTSLNSCDKAIARVYRAFERATIFMRENIEVEASNKESLFWNRFCNSMNDDFNTAKCIGIFFDAVKQMNKTINKFNNKNRINDITELNKIMDAIKLMGKTLGILNFTSYNSSIPKNKQISLKEIEKLILERDYARTNKNWEKADSIREYLMNQGINIEDRNDKTIWKTTK